ncbi:hypothetical protein MWN33_11560 [Starkeya koreensis]|uniref:Uncharacterized protein n=1 Tax=Ancylobacter koreensis TaxID=266121 RepID=A0ABT0DN09_9HYPH|nr:hypothetical protein [Ancylobacter koreensis]MCK0208663.1 hypothetical protein [Ancylobacter koreensis]
MGMRTRETTVTFRHPFKLSTIDRSQPAGTYRVVIDEEDIPDITFLAYRRSATMLHTPAIAAAGSIQVFTVNPDELAKALDADLRTGSCV